MGLIIIKTSKDLSSSTFICRMNKDRAKGQKEGERKEINKERLKVSNARKKDWKGRYERLKERQERKDGKTEIKKAQRPPSD